MNPLVRMVLGVLVGDFIFAASAALLFYLVRVDPHAPANPGFMLGAIVYGIAFALLSGFVAGSISGRADLVTGILLGIIIAIPARITLVARPGQGAIGSQTAAWY